MQDRRNFLGSIILPAGFVAAGGARAFGLSGASAESFAASERAATYSGHALAEALSVKHATPEEGAYDENFWGAVAQAFTQDRSIVNLNNGGCSPSPRVVQEAMKRHLDYANCMPPPHALWQVQDKQIPAVKAKLSMAFGGRPEELAITRNSSESLQTCLFGHDLKPGDEVLTTTQDYPRMITTLKQRERREGIVLRQIKIPIPCEDPALIVRLFQEAITPMTRLILCSHMINITGQIMPVREIVRMARIAREKDPIPVVVDGAHALAHFQFRLDDLDCDFYGVSLHKWLFAPHGTGLLYVRKEKIKSLWPLMAANAEQDDTIAKFEEIGTHPAANFLAIAEAVEFHEMIGPARKEARLVQLRDMWTRRLLEHKPGRVRLHTSLKAPEQGENVARRPDRWMNQRFACGIATFQIDGIDSVDLVNHLWDKHRILATAIKHEEFEGVRVTPSVYTSFGDIERFCSAVTGVIDSGLPKPATTAG